MSLVLKKTDLGREQITKKSAALEVRERAALILIDGKRNLADVEAIIGAGAEGIARRLMALGLVQPAGGPLAGMEFADSGVAEAQAANVSQFAQFFAVTQPSALEFADTVKPADSVSVSARGLLLGKLYLGDVAERLLGKDDALLRKKIQQVASADELFIVYELVVDNLRGIASADMLAALDKRFLEALSKT